MAIPGTWVRGRVIGNYWLMFSKAPFQFSRWPSLRWGALTFGCYEIKIIRMPR